MKIVEDKKKGNRKMGLMMMKVGLVMLLIGSGSVFADYVPDDFIRNQKCSETFCKSKWDDFAVMVCNLPPEVPLPDVSAVFSGYLEGDRTCVCPCNFPKFYGH